MVKRWLTHHGYYRPGSHLEFFLNIQQLHGQKMIDPPWVWQTRISSRNFLKIQHVPAQKIIDPQYDRPGSHLEFFLKIQHVHGQKMIDTPWVW